MNLELAVYSLLALTSITCLSVILWRSWALRWGYVTPRKVVEALEACRSRNDVANLRAICENNPSALARLLHFASDHLDWPREENVSSLETAARREVVSLERGLVVLEIIIGIAPLLGLVGTILGMMDVFADIGESGLNNASALAHGISEILNATLVGLLIAIPALIAWGYFSKKVEALAVELESLCDAFIRHQYAGKNDQP